MISATLGVVSTAGALVVLAHGAWWTTLCAVALRRPGSSPPAAAGGARRCAVVIPAHNEEALIGRCVSSILASAQLAGGNIRVLVVADNCDDGTVLVAQAAGATVVERCDAQRLGKPFALDFGLAWLATNDPPEFVAFVDGDCEVGPEFVSRIAARMAEGVDAVQGHYTTFEGGTSLQRLRRVALMLVQWSRPLGSERLGIGTTIKGSGMALRWTLVSGGFPAHGVAEDAELTLLLAERNVRVWFEPAADVRGHMASTYRAARIQDRRWENGRLALMPQALGTAFRCLLHGRFGRAGTALEVGSLPLTLLVVLGASSLSLAAAGFGSVWLAGLAAGSLATYVATGLLAARASPRDLLSLAEAPRFLLHKVAVLLAVATGRGPTTWQRTDRS